jgi:hypothetical protein
LSADDVAVLEGLPGIGKLTEREKMILKRGRK